MNFPQPAPREGSCDAFVERARAPHLDDRFHLLTSQKSMFFNITLAHTRGTFVALHAGRKLRFARVA